MLGRVVAVLVDSPQAAGRHTVTFHADGLPGGVYLYRIQAGAFVARACDAAGEIAAVREVSGGVCSGGVCSGGWRLPRPALAYARLAEISERCVVLPTAKGPVAVRLPNGWKAIIARWSQLFFSSASAMFSGRESQMNL